MFCAPGLFLGGTEAVGYRFQVLHSQNCFRRYRGRRGTFSCFVLPDMFSTMPKPSGVDFLFCGSVFVSSVTEGVGSHFQVLRSPKDFLEYRSRQGSISCFALPNSFRAVPRASGTVFKFCAPRLVFDGSEDLGSRWHILRSRTCFRRYRGRRGSFSCVALPDYFWAVPRPSGLIF
jgi:hypothetical protein